jgi:SAM-dependent methyltransferase
MRCPTYCDLTVNRERRLAREGPFSRKVFQSVLARRVQDGACGTGRHVRLFVRRGPEAVGADLSPSMVEQACGDARAEGTRRSSPQRSSRTP